MRPTIHTVAERAGVSIATVSRFLNSSAHVSEATAAKVRRAVNELGYVPNASARGLAMNATRTIALIFPRLSGPFFSELIRSAEIAAHDAGYHLLVYGTSDTPQDSPDRTLDMLASKVDGLILASEDISLSYIQNARRRGMPIVMLGRRPEGMPIDSVQPDNIGGATMAVAHLIDHGRRHVGMITGPRTQQHASDRETGYRRALRDYGLTYTSQLVVEGAFDETSGYTAMAQLLQQTPSPDAVFAANDQMAIGAIAAIREAGQRVPEDIAVIGFDDIETARFILPPLTTVRQDMRGQSRLAVHMLLSRLGGSESETETRLVPTTLVCRRSCGCQPADRPAT